MIKEWNHDVSDYVVCWQYSISAHVSGFIKYKQTQTNDTQFVVIVIIWLVTPNPAGTINDLFFSTW